MASPQSDVFNFVMKSGNGVKGLLAKGIETLPRECVQPLEERIDRAEQVSDEESIPVIDFSDPEAAEAKIQEAAENWGFFQVINHGIPLQVLDNVIEAAHVFFELPAEEKMKYLRENSSSSAVEFFHHAIGGDDENSKVLEWRDSLHHECIPGDDGKFWPPETRDQVLEFSKWAKPLARKLVEMLVRGLGVKAIDQTLEPVLMGKIAVVLNYYPPCPPNPNLTIGCCRHCDICTITMLLQDDTGGLYVRGRDSDKWVHVAPVRGALAVNIGNSLQFMSNGRYKSVEHCAAVDSCKTRVSVPMFVNPSFDSVVEPLPETLDAGEKPAYKAFRFSDYWDYFMTTRPSGKAFIEYARI
ncbi:bi-functional coumaroyl CoA and feruloyl CoA ortho-hydroxylase F6H2-1-1-like [Ipomoea triloba]|uniref:bi-functional coumaroyl CoA and feruloyl CoA ortho-hydroxylase F6H2-1-1-like n=1 Tax=Ipomoea triloba TaxID=35885 RepID=UPI00125E57BC|nr:bi-functional coumaroyl CoA and feruloyl CoA ortho-hydroxylase F6H2-1-1-like [Ipomoea triloba]